MAYSRKATKVLAFLLVVTALPGLAFGAVKPPPEGRNEPGGIGEEPQRKADQAANIKETAGEIAAVDRTTGELMLKEISAGKPAETHDYVINQRDTIVTDPLDKQFLKIEDLQPGYLVRVEYAEVEGRRLARKITVDSINDLRWAVGQISTVDPKGRTITLLHEPAIAGTAPVVTLYETTGQTQVIDLTGSRFIRFEELKPGDAVQVEFTLQDGRRVARLISQLEPAGPQVIWSAGRIEAVDLNTGVLVVSEQIPRWDYSERVNYIVDLDRTRIVDLRGRRFLSLNDLAPGQPVRLQFVDLAGQRSVQCVVLKP